VRKNYSVRVICSSHRRCVKCSTTFG